MLRSDGQRRVAIVGAGPNGLAAGVTLAREGCRVVIYEAADRIGGGTRTEDLTLPGFHHDVCSAVHPMGIASPFLRTLNLERYGLEWIHPPLAMAHPFDDGTAAWLDHSTVLTGESLDPGDDIAYRKLMDPFVRDWPALFSDALAPPVRIPRHPLLMARLGWYGMRPAMSLARSCFQGPRARALFVGIAAHTLLPMEKIPSAAFGLMLGVAAHGAGWPIPKRGSQSIANALAALFRELGGEIEINEPVHSLDGMEEADVVVLDVTPRQLLSIAGDRLPAGYRAQLRRWRYAPGVFKIDWALSEPIPWTADACRRAGTLHLAGPAAEVARSAAAAWDGAQDEKPFVLLAQPSLFDPTRAPEGRHTAWAYCHVPHGSTADMTEAIERQVERFAPGFRETILARHTMNPRALEIHNPNLVGGDINGGVQDIHQFLFRPSIRLDPYSTPNPRIFLCSASTPPGGAVHGMCGYHAAQSVLGRGSEVLEF